MWAVWITVSGSILLGLVLWYGLWSSLRAASRGWRWLSLSSIPLSLTGINFILRFWEPTAGPYRANELYPYGNHLQAWAVSLGFAWLAFGLLFAGLALLGAREATRLVWGILLASWFLCWLPHGLIGIAFAWAGSNAPSVEAYRKWAAAPPGLMLLLFNSTCLLAHFGLSLVGFVLTGLELRRHRLRPTT